MVEGDRARKMRELDWLLARDKMLDMLFERIYKVNVSGKTDDVRFSKISKRYEQEQGENVGRMKVLRLELKKSEDKRMDVELIQYIEVYPTVKADGVTSHRVTIHYNCIGAFEVPNRRKISERDILL